MAVDENFSSAELRHLVVLAIMRFYLDKVNPSGVMKQRLTGAPPELHLEVHT